MSCTLDYGIIVRLSIAENLLKMRGDDPNAEPACTKRKYELTHADLPLSCPTKEMRVWDAHPRVYLPIEETGDYTCPYCGAEYVLKDFIPPENI